ncbi:hypothetical protein [Actinoplanes sp. NPDC026670]|uniref:hypothetical protein n=1 Tax=Actinoplanes sp. NPDC026670 TaxID=3154700 RepID=UPI0033EB91E5
MGLIQAAWVASSWATSHPSPNGAIAEAARTGEPSSKVSAEVSSISSRTPSILAPRQRNLAP